MPYDAKLDEKLFSKAWEGDNGNITVSVHSYNKGAKKIQITRESANEDGQARFAKLGRMTKDELQGILPLLQEAIAHMD